MVTPKLPPPPPRNAQNRSGCELADAVTSLTTGQHHGGRPQCIRHQAGMPGMRTESAAQGVTRRAHRWTGTGWDTATRGRQHLVHRIQTRRGCHRDEAGSGVVVDVTGQLPQIEHHRAVRGGGSYVGMPAAARSDLEIICGGERHRLLHVGRRCRNDHRRRRHPVVVGVENRFGRTELRRVRPDDLPADRTARPSPKRAAHHRHAPGRRMRPRPTPLRRRAEMSDARFAHRRSSCPNCHVREPETRRDTQHVLGRVSPQTCANLNLVVFWT